MKENENLIAPRKLKLLVTVVNREKAEFYTDFIQSFEVNFQTSVNGRGTASKETLRLLGIGETDKTVIFSVIREDLCDEKGLTLWCCGDQIRKGAASNAVQILKKLIEE